MPELTEADRAAYADRRRSLARRGISIPRQWAYEYRQEEEDEIAELLRGAESSDDADSRAAEER